MSSLRDVAHEGKLCTLTADENSISSQPLLRQQVRWGTARRPSRTKNHIYRVTLLQPARRAAVLGQPSSLRSHWLRLRTKIAINMREITVKLFNIQDK